MQLAYSQQNVHYKTNKGTKTRRSNYQNLHLYIFQYPRQKLKYYYSKSSVPKTLMLIVNKLI
jgi:hypothetical protein